MTRIETTKRVLYHLGSDWNGDGRETAVSISKALAQEVADLGRRIAIAATLGPVEVVTVE